MQFVSAKAARCRNLKGVGTVEIDSRSFLHVGERLGPIVVARIMLTNIGGECVQIEAASGRAR